jgi:ankyrin repeat protein
VNAKNERGYIPLHWAAQYGKAKACSTLLANGADVNAKVTKNEVTALHLAAQEGHKHVILIYE